MARGATLAPAPPLPPMPGVGEPTKELSDRIKGMFTPAAAAHVDTIKEDKDPSLKA